MHCVAGGDGVCGLGIPEQNIGVLAGSDHTLLRHAEDAGGRGATELDKPLRGELALGHAKVPEDLQPVLDAWAAVGNFAEVVFAQRFLVGKAERAMVGGDDGQRAVLERLPQRGLVVLFCAEAG